MMFRLDDETARSKREAFLDTQRRYALDARIAKAEDPTVYSERIANGEERKSARGRSAYEQGLLSRRRAFLPLLIRRSAWLS